MTEAPLGTVRGMSLMAFSTETWDDLEPDHQQLLLKRSPMGWRTMMIAQEELAEKSRADAKNSGVEFHKGDADLVAALAPSDANKELIAVYAANIGVDNHSEQIDAFNTALTKWEGIVARTGHDCEAFAQALWEEVYSKLD